jgi:hypothetical protein
MNISEPVKSVVIDTWVWLSPAITVSSAATGAAIGQRSAARTAAGPVNREVNRGVNVRPPRPW